MSKSTFGKLDTKALEKLRVEYHEWIERSERMEQRLIAYRTPCCGAEIKTVPASRGVQWDSTSYCPLCGRMHINITRGAKAYGFIPEAF